ncbi:MAG: hypothetical protein RIG62_05075 [Cyclobacteriaceae bacterium]
MKRLFVGVLTLVFSTTVIAQTAILPDRTLFRVLETDSPRISPDLFSRFMAVQPGISNQAQQEKYLELNAFVQHLNQRLQKSRSTEQFLKYLFYRVHRTHLKEYQSYATLNSILTEGVYDCVSATALYALLLDALHIKFSVQEMTYHVYLEIPVGEEAVLLESTDPLAGFVVGTENIAARLAQYQAEEIDQAVYSRAIQARVGMTELVGLTHFNAAVNYYNQQKLAPARQHLQQAIQWYPAERMYALQALIESVATR